MNRIPDLIRQANPIGHLALPEGRAERELIALIGEAPSKPPTREAHARQTRAPMLITAVVLVILVAATALLTSLGVRRAQPADSTDQAQMITFDGSSSGQEQDRRTLASVLSGATVSETEARRVGVAFSHSPELRPPSGSQGFAWGRLAAGVGSTTIAADSSADFEGRTTGGAGTGSDVVTVLVLRCSGTGDYRWTVRGHTVQSDLDRTIATASGNCVSGASAARYILGGKDIRTSIDLDLPAGASFSLAEVTYGPFDSPTLDNPFPR